MGVAKRAEDRRQTQWRSADPRSVTAGKFQRSEGRYGERGTKIFAAGGCPKAKSEACLRKG